MKKLIIAVVFSLGLIASTLSARYTIENMTKADVTVQVRGEDIILEEVTIAPKMVRSFPLCDVISIRQGDKYQAFSPEECEEGKFIIPWSKKSISLKQKYKNKYYNVPKR